MGYKFLLGVVAIVFAGASFAHAQTIDGSVPAPVQYIVSPETPGPNQVTNIEIEGVGQFLGDSQITWQENGQTISSANNQESFSFTTGGIGTGTRIDVTIVSATQGTISREFVFYPSVINLVWEADTYTPLLYQGKALYSAGSGLKVVAFPTVMLGGALIPAAKLSYQWSDNDTPNTAASGLGRNVFSFQGDQLQSGEDVSVTVYSGTTAVGKGEITIPVSSPQIILYAEDPLRGELLGSGFQGSATLGQTETTFKAEPYFFSNSSVQNNSLVYNWTLDSQETTGPNAAQGELTLRQTGSGSGSADLGVSIQNTDSSKYVQTASAALTLAFGPQGGSALSNFFGL
jgi:hypothetical protein